jgi:hypothetical protein
LSQWSDLDGTDTTHYPDRHPYERERAFEAGRMS